MNPKRSDNEIQLLLGFDLDYLRNLERLARQKYYKAKTIDSPNLPRLHDMYFLLKDVIYSKFSEIYEQTN